MDTYKAIDLERPHGFLIWRGKQTAIGSKDKLPVGEPLVIISDSEAYGTLTLKEPAQMAVKVFDSQEQSRSHCIRPEERKQWWPDATALWVHDIESFEKLDEMAPVEITKSNGLLCEIEYRDVVPLSDDEAALVEQVRRLPKQIILSPNAVALTGAKFYDCEDSYILTDELAASILPAFKSKLEGALRAVCNLQEINYASQGDCKHMPIYQLALVRLPRFDIQGEGELKKKEVVAVESSKQEEADMPYEIQERNDGQWCVIKTETGEEEHCYEGADAEDKARALLAALRINVEEEEGQKQFDDSTWDGAASNWDTAAAYCRDCLIDVNPAGEDKVKDLCFLPYRKPGADSPNRAAIRAIVGGRGITRLQKPDDVSPDAWGSKLKAAANKIIGWYPGAFEQAAPESVYRIAGRERPEEKQIEEDEKVGRRLKKGWRAKLKELVGVLKEMLSWADYDDLEETAKEFESESGFTVKQIQGEPWFFSWTTNAFKDRQCEIFSTKSLEQYVAENEKNDDKGYFNVWHIPNTDFARKEWQGVVGRFLVEAGPFLEDAKGQAAKQFFRQYPQRHPTIAPEGWGMSPEFRFLPEEREKGIYNWLWITRSSVLARAAAANIWTEGGITEMALSKQQEEAGKTIFGEDLFNSLVAEGEQKTAELEEAGVAHKSEEKEQQAENTGEEEGQEQGEKATEFTLDDIVTAVAQQVSGDFAPITEAMVKMAEQVAEVTARIQKLEKDEQIRQKAEVPRFMLQVKRASEAEETALSDDELKETAKPKEANSGDQSLAGHYFGK